MSEHGRNKPNPRYPAKMREFARRAYEKGHSAYRIREFLRVQGHDPVPSDNTILCWVDDEYREIQRIKQRRWGPPGPKRAKAWEARLDRMKQLREAGLSYRSIAAIAKLDFNGLAIGAEQVRGVLKGTTSERMTQLLLDPDRAQGITRIGPLPKALRPCETATHSTKGPNP